MINSNYTHKENCYFSPLRYPGGKRRVTRYIKQVISDNSLKDCLYIEPYGGGASVALSLLFDGFARKIIINDIDWSIYCFWYSILNYSKEFIYLIQTTPINIDEWHKQKEIQTSVLSDKLRLGFSTFFLNRTNRSGILNAGIIGGLKQNTNLKINARFNKTNLIKRIEKIAQYKSKIKIYNWDAVELINKYGKSKNDRLLFYLDPPYYIKGKDLYLNYYNDEDHRLVYKSILELAAKKWIITYDDVKFITKMYSNFNKRRFRLNYSASATNKSGNEIMIFSNNLLIPAKPIIQPVSS